MLLARWWIAPLVAGLFVVPRDVPQGVPSPGSRTASQHDCRLARPAIDQPWPRVSLTQRRWQWHLERFLSANVVAALVHRTTHASARGSALAAQTLTTTLPHVIGLASHAYPLNARDVFLADPVINSAPLFWITEPTARDRMFALGAFAALYAAIACFASP